MIQRNSIDITAEPMATTLMANLATPDNAAVLRAFQDTAARLDYRLLKQLTIESLPDAAHQAFNEAVAVVAAQDCAALVISEIIGALGRQGIFLHMGASTTDLLRAESQRTARVVPLLFREVEDVPPAAAEREPRRLSVDVSNDQVVVSGEGLLTTYNWRANAYDNRVARLSIVSTEPALRPSDDATYSVVSGEGASRMAHLIADNLSKAEALALIDRIQVGVKHALGIGAVPESVVDLNAPDMSPVAESESNTPPRGHALLESIAKGVWRVLWIGVCAVAGSAAVGAAVFVLPIVYRIGQHVSAHLIDLALGGHPALLGLLS